ncbi:hypothetical protein SETIT_4G077600v2 [Setaria italica]|uniref:Pentacotripeptide-repeat region of PRORP domain-containing protein n=2 Tax=Setaria italica TaxID=4555 RepID=A0A368QSE9_SETIT|nr:pentatricopeptide repeat-containing protein At3g29230 [Setaria italica]RCV20698.1 hypothetical protein SETIT_4G077600v2 [Setaria italica]
MLPHAHAALVRAVTACAGCREAQALHSLAWKLGLASDVVLATALLTRYARRGLLAPAQWLFDEMPRRDVVAFNAMLAALGAAGRVADARELFDRMLERTPASWNTMVTCYCRAGDLGSARLVFEASLRAGRSSVVSWNAMIDGYCKAGRMDAARDLFDRMGSSLPDVVTWNTVMAGYLHRGDPATAIAIFHRLMHVYQQQQRQEEHKLKPTTVTMATAVTACTQVGDFALGRRIHLQIRHQGTRTDAVLSNALMDMYFKCGSVDGALDVFRTMPCRPNLFCWNTVIAGLGMNGRGEDAVAAFHDMVEGRPNGDNVKPDGVTFVAVLSACSHSGLVPAGRKLFTDMLPVHGVAPRTEHYGCMADLLCRAGHADEAARLVRTMPGRPNAKVLGSLLLDARAPERQEDGVRLSEWAARRISELDVGDGAAYGLSNVYASLQRWERVEEHRREVSAAVRQGKGPRRKQPGRACYDLASSCTN